MDDLRQQMGATLSERYTSQQKGTAKMMNDYEQMRKELGKVLFRTFFDLWKFKKNCNVGLVVWIAVMIVIVFYLWCLNVDV